MFVLSSSYQLVGSKGVVIERFKRLIPCVSCIKLAASIYRRTWLWHYRTEFYAFGFQRDRRGLRSYECSQGTRYPNEEYPRHRQSDRLPDISASRARGFLPPLR